LIVETEAAKDVKNYNKSFGWGQELRRGMHLPERSASGCGIEGVANMMQTIAATSATPSTAHNLGGRRRLQKMSDQRLLLAAPAKTPTPTL
jgi:hypothetical protein